ncbi:MAG TPA: hypothetical protein VLD35_11270 [Caldimonas sp.]|nr:hypothetical protein [Caldimonas sp.]
MTSTATVSLALVVAALATACAADTTTAPGNETRGPVEYRTGSNIPVREPRTSAPAEKARPVTPADASRPADSGVKPAN